MSTDEFTERERNLMALAWQCFDDAPKLNYDKLAGLAGFTNPRSASNAWATIRKKLNSQASSITGGDTAAAGTSPAKSPAKKATPRKRGKKAAGEDDDEDAETPAPKKARKAKATPKKSAAAVVDDDVAGREFEEADGDFI